MHEGGHNNSSAKKLSRDAQSRERGRDSCDHAHYFLSECAAHSDEQLRTTVLEERVFSISRVPEAPRSSKRWHLSTKLQGVTP